MEQLTFWSEARRAKACLSQEIKKGSTTREAPSPSSMSNFLDRLGHAGLYGRTSLTRSAVTGGDVKEFFRQITEIGYGVCWRVFDAEYVRVDGFPGAVPQRRRRIFAVGYLGDWRPAAKVLFESKMLCGDTAPRRIKGQATSCDTEKRTGESNALDANAGTADAVRNTVETGKGFYRESDVGGTLEAHEDQHRRNIVCMATGQGNAECHENCAVNLTCNHEAPIVGAFMPGQGAKAGSIAWSEEHYPALRAGDSGTNRVPAVVCLNDQGGSVMRIEKEGAIGTLRANTHGNNPIICVHGSQDPITKTDHANAVNRNQGLKTVLPSVSTGMLPEV